MSRPTWRVRILEENMLGRFDPPIYLDSLEDAKAARDRLAAAGHRTIIETLAGGRAWRPPQPAIPTAAELTESGLARRGPDGHYWIDPDGLDLIREASHETI